MKATLPEPEIVTRKGKPVSVIIPIKDYEELLERVEDADDAALQAAMDAAAAAGKTVVCLRGIGGGDPNWYTLNGEVHVHGSVRLILGLGFGCVIGGNQGRFVVDDRSAPAVKFLHLHAFGGRPLVVENRSATNTLIVESCDLRAVGSGGGDIFVTDCPSSLELRSPGQSLWAHQLIPEGDSDSGLVQNHGGRLWALGVEHESRGVRFLTDRGGQTEVRRGLTHLVRLQGRRLEEVHPPH